MSKFSFRQKLDYNRKRKDCSDFSQGYVNGTGVYDRYKKSRGEKKKFYKGLLDKIISNAKTKKDDKSKGFACGVRDASEYLKDNPNKDI